MQANHFLTPDHTVLTSKNFHFYNERKCFIHSIWMTFELSFQKLWKYFVVSMENDLFHFILKLSKFRTFHCFFNNLFKLASFGNVQLSMICVRFMLIGVMSEFHSKTKQVSPAKKSFNLPCAISIPEELMASKFKTATWKALESKKILLQKFSSSSSSFGSNEINFKVTKFSYINVPSNRFRRFYTWLDCSFTRFVFAVRTENMQTLFCW